jgi:acetyltransferase-like isoleucine patch superfamily enzyme
VGVLVGIGVDVIAFVNVVVSDIVDEGVRVGEYVCVTDGVSDSESVGDRVYEGDSVCDGVNDGVDVPVFVICGVAETVQL